MVVCLALGADMHMAQLMPMPLTVSCSSKIQIGFTVLVLAHPGSPGKRAIKRVCVCACTSSQPVIDNAYSSSSSDMQATRHTDILVTIFHDINQTKCITYFYYVLSPRPSGCQQNGTIHVSKPPWNEMGQLVSSNSVPYFCYCYLVFIQSAYF